MECEFVLGGEKTQKLALARALEVSWVSATMKFWRISVLTGNWLKLETELHELHWLE